MGEFLNSVFNVTVPSSGINLGLFRGRYSTPRTITPPGTPTNLMTVPSSNVTVLTINWNAPTTGSPQTGYTIRWITVRVGGEDGITYGNNTLIDKTASEVSYTGNAVDGYTTQIMYIRAYNTKGESAWIHSDAIGYDTGYAFSEYIISQELTPPP